LAILTKLLLSFQYAGQLKFRLALFLVEEPRLAAKVLQLILMLQLEVLFLE